MNKRQLEVEKAKLKAEEQELKRLEAIYRKASQDISEKIGFHDAKIDSLKDIDEMDDAQRSVLQSQIYQKNYQKSLQKQIDGFLKDLKGKQYKSVDDYIKNCYNDGFLGCMYDIAGQGIPIITPIDQKKVIKAMTVDSKINKSLYSKLGEDVEILKKRIANNISRGIAAGDSYANIARNIANGSRVGFNKAMRIARTEGHRVQQAATADAQFAAKEKGADIVKQWDSTLDGNTRPHHRQLDGQIRELEEPFEVGGMKPMHPSDFGRPEEDINCRCTILQRAKWALDDDELETLKERAKYFGLDKTEDFNDFKKKYLKAAKTIETKPTAYIPVKTIEEAEDFIRQYVDDSQFGALGVSYKGISVESANAVNEALFKLFDEYEIGKLGGVLVPKGNTKLGKLISGAKAAYMPVRKSFLLNKDTFKNVKTLTKKINEEKRLIEEYIKNPTSFTFTSKRAEKVAKASILSGRATVPETIEDIINHEFGHTFEKAISQMDNYNLIKANMPKYAEKISGYATTEMGEYIAESFAAYRKGEKIVDSELVKAFEKLKNSKVSVAKTAQKNIVKFGDDSIIITDKQFGKKAGKHAKDYGLEPDNVKDREKFRNIIDDIVTNHTELYIGDWKGQSEECYFWVKDGDVVISTVDSKRFVTVMKGRMDDAGLKKARRTKI